MEDILKVIFGQYRQELKLEFERAETLLRLNRIYDSGKVLELAIKNLLLKLLPDYTGVTRGIIFDSDVNQKSNEIDLIIYDKRYFSGFEVDNSGEDSLSLISIDVVFGVISVKKTLTIKNLKNSIKNIQSVYGLHRRILANQLHYDIPLSPPLEYKEGIESNKIFSCIIACENDLIFKSVKGNRVEKSEKEIRIYFDKLTKKGIFDNYCADLIYTIDGTIYFPINLDQKTKKFHRTASIEYLGSIKKPLIPYLDGKTVQANIQDIIFAYTVNLRQSEKILGQFIFYLLIYITQLVKSSPDTTRIIQTFFKDEKIENLQIARKLEDIQK